MRTPADDPRRRSWPPHQGAREIGDRKLAIALAIAELRAGDVLVLCGKGHERGQIIGDKTIPFDDAAMARAAINALQSIFPSPRRGEDRMGGSLRDRI